MKRKRERSWLSHHIGSFTSITHNYTWCVGPSGLTLSVIHKMFWCSGLPLMNYSLDDSSKHDFSCESPFLPFANIAWIYVLIPDLFGFHTKTKSANQLNFFCWMKVWIMPEIITQRTIFVFILKTLLKMLYVDRSTSPEPLTFNKINEGRSLQFNV